MGTLVLTPIAIYAAYLAGYLGAPPGDIIDTNDLTREAPSPVAVTLLAAYSLGVHDRQLEPRASRTMRNVVALVNDRMADKELISQDEAREMAVEAVGSLDVPEDAISILGRSIYRAVNGVTSG